MLTIAGAVQSGLKWHPDGRYVAYPLGSTIVVKDTTTNKQVFLSGHTDRITAVAMSPDGRFLASGQRTNMGFKVRAPFDVVDPGRLPTVGAAVQAPILLWDLATAVATGDGSKALLHRLVLHKVAVQAMDFSADSALLASLGGQDDNSLVVWDVASGAAICGSPAASHAALTVKWLRRRNDRLLTGGQYHLRSWAFQVGRQGCLC